MFDPDYRRKGWNRSIFAPKRRPAPGCSITSLSLLVILTLSAFIFASVILPIVDQTAYQRVLDTNGSTSLNVARLSTITASPYFIVGLFGFMIAWGVLARLIRVIVWASLDKQEEPERTITEHPQRPADFIKSPALHLLSPAEFERQVATLISEKTGLKTVVTGGAGDGGVDIRVEKDKQLVGVIQCKRYQPGKALPPAYVRELATVKRQHHVRIAYLVTTAQFSPDTRTVAADLGIRLIDGADLARMHADHLRRIAPHHQPAADQLMP